MIAIVAVDKHWGIGYENNLLFSIPKDMKHFRNMTLGKVVVMGHSTLRSFPGQRPLPDRKNVVLSRNQELEIPEAAVVHSLTELTLYLQQYKKEDIVVAGGQMIYEQLLDFCSEVYVTKVQASRTSDSYYPNLDRLPNWELSEVSEPVTSNELTFTINRYTNKQVKSLEDVFTPLTLSVRGLTIGSQRPKVCLPLVGTNRTQLIKECEHALVEGAEMIEWRADFCSECSVDTLTNILLEIRQAIGNLPLIFTLRSKKEGGKADLSPKSFSTITRKVVESGVADFIDLELSLEKELLSSLMKHAKAHGVHTILSYHNLHNTPPKEEMVHILSEMEQRGASISKIAVYPRTPLDVLELLAASEAFSSLATNPYIAISMSWLGSLSRVAGEFFGSAITFACGYQCSAAGQIPVRELKETLTVLEPEEPKEYI